MENFVKVIQSHKNQTSCVKSLFKSQNGPYLAKTGKDPSKSLICCTVYGKLPKN